MTMSLVLPAAPRLERLRAAPRKPGEASFFFYDAHFKNDAVKILPGEYFVLEQKFPIVDRMLHEPAVQRLIPRGITFRWSADPTSRGAQAYSPAAICIPAGAPSRTRRSPATSSELTGSSK